MTIHCPTCGHDLDAPPTAASLASAKMRPQDRIIVAVLAKAYPRGVRTSVLVEALYSNDPNGGPEGPKQVIRARMTHLRKVLPAYGWTVPDNTAGAGNYGEYRLEKIGSGRNA